MKKALTLLVGIALFWGCTREDIMTSESGSTAPALAGSASDPHPALDIVCQQADTIFLLSEDGSELVNKCFGANGQITCPPNQKRWGYVILKEGYYAGVGYMDCDISLSPGWYGELTSWKVGGTVAGGASTFEFDGNGIPLRQGDWGTEAYSPYENRWSLRFPTSNLPSEGFDLIIMVQAVRLNIYGAINSASETILWGKNPDAANPASPYFSPVSPMVTRFTPLRCQESQIVTDQVCTSLTVGAPALDNCKTISANTDGMSGSLTYLWSTGATTASISVCPTATTTYSVTISRNGVPAKVSEITVNYADIACGNGNGNNGFHKVTVCHLPPGNPTNMQEICIDWSGVPAHVAEYRPAGSQQGHDSGCQIGRCGSNPCL